jgi:retron-type reverse transcriptase
MWRTEADLAKALGISEKELRFFSIHRQAERVRHYVTYTIPKANGGRRLIMAPKRRLKALQRILLAKLVKKLPVSEYAHGYIDDRSVRGGAEPHVGRKVLVQLDLKDFFPTITYGRVRGLFIALGYGYPVAAAMAALVTEAERQPVEIDGVVYYVPVGRRHTVQGAPTSPGLSNCLLLRLDRRLAGLAKKLKFTYTRYADDLTFSSDSDERIQQLRHAARRIIGEEGFEVNAAKTRTSRRGRRQRVTGVIVNETLGLSRQDRRKLRAAIHQLSRDVAARKKIDPARVRKIRGKLGYLAMLNPEQAKALERGMPDGM